MPDLRYVAEADVTAYWTTHGGVPAAWSDASAADQLGATYTASEWLDQAYRTRWLGTRSDPTTQVRDWPRSGVVDQQGNPVASDVAPAAIKDATCIAAVLQVSGTLPETRSTTEIEQLVEPYVQTSGLVVPSTPGDALAVIDRAIAAHLASGGVTSLSINGRSQTFESIEALMKVRAQYQLEASRSTSGRLRTLYRRGRA